MRILNFVSDTRYATILDRVEGENKRIFKPSWSDYTCAHSGVRDYIYNKGIDRSAGGWTAELLWNNSQFG